MHWKRWNRHGDPEHVEVVQLHGATIEERLLARIEETDDGCWVWTGAQQGAGYGMLRVDGEGASAHRLAHEEWIGPIPDGLEIDHLCRVRLCINPEHLEAVTHLENMRRRP